MGMSTHIKAFIEDNDPDYLFHKEILLFCKSKNISLPKETSEYFGNLSPNESLLSEKLEIELMEGLDYIEWKDKSSEGFEVDLTHLPKGVTKIRFYNSW